MKRLLHIAGLLTLTGLTACVDLSAASSPVPPGESRQSDFPSNGRNKDPMAGSMPAKKVIPPGQTSGVYKGQPYVCATPSCKTAIPVPYPPPPTEKKK
ncbi:hypothetical protein [Asticcacaulis benevestitus]|nr:hypothetical protein [Asticcacaulis benevestitus]